MELYSLLRLRFVLLRGNLVSLLKVFLYHIPDMLLHVHSRKLFQHTSFSNGKASHQKKGKND
jgi:hypothetical protein